MARHPHTLPFRQILALLLFCLPAQVVVGQQPNPPSGTHRPSATETSAVDAASTAADQIVAAQSGDNKKQADKALKAWKEARKDQRLVIIETPPGKKRAHKGFTWPDTPSDPALPPEAAAAMGSYKPGQTANQWTALEQTFLAQACPCAVAVVILHEGWRLNQDTPGSPGDPAGPNYLSNGARITQNAQQLAVFDLNNIAAARTACQGEDPKCKAALDELEDQARSVLSDANRNAEFITGQPNGPNVPQVSAPYPPTH